MATAGGAFKGGVFGLFGVIAGMAGLVVALAVIGAARTPPGPAPIAAASWAAYCREGWPQLEARYRLAGALAEAEAPSLLADGPPPRLSCHAADRRGVIDFAVKVDCAVKGATSCSFVTGALRDGEEIPLDLD
jgi:hypothetical protein